MESREEGKADCLYKWYYEQEATDEQASNLDLAFSDDMLDAVEKQWAEIVDNNANAGEFMKFEERNGADDDGDENEAY